eukprot:scaffold517_cov119-Cylindrotheca_fusiformis.AAC.13
MAIQPITKKADRNSYIYTCIPDNSALAILGPSLLISFTQLIAFTYRRLDHMDSIPLPAYTLPLITYG